MRFAFCAEPIGTSGERVNVRVKICGITRARDARTAARLGADYLGLICAPSPRRIDPEEIAPWMSEVRDEFPRLEWVGVFVNPDPVEMAEVSDRLRLDLIQIHGVDPARVPSSRPWIWATHAEPFLKSRSTSWEGNAPFAVLLDTPDPERVGGTGRPFGWSSIGDVSTEVRLFLAGGLGPDNVAAAIASTRPFAVDASSRLEGAPGEKDSARLTDFFAAIARVREGDGDVTRESSR